MAQRQGMPEKSYSNGNVEALKPDYQVMQGLTAARWYPSVWENNGPRNEWPCCRKAKCNKSK
jgi:hypothetical protein